MSYSYAYVPLSVQSERLTDFNLRLVLIIVLVILTYIAGSIIGNTSVMHDHRDRHHKDHDQPNFTDPNLDPEADVEEGD